MTSITTNSKYDDKASSHFIQHRASYNLEGHDFLSTVSMLDDVAEQQALRILIQKNTALAKKTIWQYIIVKIGEQYKAQIEKLLSNPDMKEEKIKNLRGPTNLPGAIRAGLKEGKDALELVELYIFWNESEIIERGGISLTLTEKSTFLALALRLLGVSVPSLDATGRALERLTALGFILKRNVEGKHAKALFYVNPEVYMLWEKQKAEVDKKPKKSEVERFWFE